MQEQRDYSGCVAVDPAVDASMLGVFPNLSFATSRSLNWPGVEIHRCHAAPWETPEFSLTQHWIEIVRTTRPINFHVAWAGRHQSVSLDDGAINIVPCAMPQKMSWDHTSESTSIFLDQSVLDDKADGAEISSFELIPKCGTHDVLIFGIATALEQELEAGGPSPRLYVDSLIAALANHLAVKYSCRVPRSIRVSIAPAQLKRAIEFMRDNLHRDISLSEMSSVAQMSKYHFAKCFKRAIGMPPHQHLVQLRVEQACRLIKTRKFSMEEIAYRVGYVDKNHFAAQFRRITGTTPYGYRRAIAS
jgi:AraC family transcriptional regulator